MSTAPNLTIKIEGNKFVIRDEKNSKYGTYESKTEANAILADWQNYYKSPLL